MPDLRRKKLRLHHGIDGCVATYDEQRRHDQDKAAQRWLRTQRFTKAWPMCRARRPLEAPRASLRNR